MVNAEYVRQRYQWLKAHGICVSCGNADAEPGRVRCRKCLDVRKELSRKWKQEHAERVKEYQRIYQPMYRQRNPCIGAGRVVEKKPRITKPNGMCRRKDCWESALPFSCWCQEHRKEMSERRCLKTYLNANASASTEKYSPRPK